MKKPYIKPQTDWTSFRLIEPLAADGDNPEIIIGDSTPGSPGTIDTGVVGGDP